MHMACVFFGHVAECTRREYLPASPSPPPPTSQRGLRLRLDYNAHTCEMNSRGKKDAMEREVGGVVVALAGSYRL